MTPIRRIYTDKKSATIPNIRVVRVLKLDGEFLQPDDFTKVKLRVIIIRVFSVFRLYQNVF